MSKAFERAKKTFLGFLQARGKSQNTIKNYACDLTELGNFCVRSGFDFQNLGVTQLEAYHFEMQSRGLKTNSRRRKLMTAKTFLRYLSGRMDVSTIGSEKLIPPEKVEALPPLIARSAVLTLIDLQPPTQMGLRNRALLLLLLHTGMLVTEALQLKRKNLSDLGFIQIEGKRARTLRIDAATADALRELQSNPAKYFFYGFSKAGPNPERMTPRGVELLFKNWSKLHSDLIGPFIFHPRTLRHLYVVEQIMLRKSQNEMMQNLGIKTPYSFRIYKDYFDQINSNQPLPSAPAQGIEAEL